MKQDPQVQSYFQNLSHAGVFVKDPLQQEPDLAITQKRQNIQRVAITSIVGILASLPMFILPFFYGEELVSIYQTLLIVFGASNLLFSILALLWTRSKSLLKDKNSQNRGQNDEDLTSFYNPMGDAVFGFGSLQIAINILLITSTFAFEEVNQGRFVGEFGSSNELINAFNSNYSTLQIIYSILAFILIIVLATFVYATFYCSISYKTLRIFGNIYNLIWLSLCGWGAYLTRDILPFLQLQGFKELLSENQLDTAFGILIGYGVFSFGIFTIIALKNRRYHVPLGAILLVLVVILAGLNFNYIKSVQSIKASFSSDCDNQLYDFPEATLASLGCTKYVQTNGQFDTTCANDASLKKYFKVNWDIKIQNGKELHEEDKPDACLNGNCCMTYAEFYAHKPRVLVFTIISLTIIGFLITYGCFLLSTKEKVQGQNEPHKDCEFSTIDAVFIVLLIGIAVTGCFVIAQQINFLPKMRSEYPVIPASKPAPKPATLPPTPVSTPTQPAKLKTTLKPALENSQFKQQYANPNLLLSSLVNEDVYPTSGLVSECQSVKNYIDDDNFQGVFDFDVDDSLQGDAIRVSLLASRGTFKYTKDNSGKLFFLEEDGIRESIFTFVANNEAKNSMPFFSLTGLPQDVNEFLNKDLFYCGCNPKNSPHFVIESFQTALPQIQSPKPSMAITKNIVSQSNSKGNGDAVKISKEITHNNHPRTLVEINSVTTTTQPGDKCQQEYDQELKKQDTCSFRTGNYKLHKGNFSFIANSLKIDSAKKQTVSGRIVTVDPQNVSQYLPVCNQIVTVKVVDEFGKEQQLGSSQTDNSSGIFSISLPTFSKQVAFAIQLEVKNAAFQDILKTFLLDGHNYSLGNVYLSSFFSTTQAVPTQNKCSAQPQNVNKDTIYHTNKIHKSPKAHRNSQKAAQSQNTCEMVESLKKSNAAYCPLSQIYGSASKSEQDSSFDQQSSSSYSQQQTSFPSIGSKTEDKINDIKFVNIEVKLEDLLSKNTKNQTSEKTPFGNASVKLMNNHVECSSEQSEKALFIGGLANSDSVIIFNQSSGDYTLSVSFDDNSFHSYCKTFSLLSKDSSNYTIYVPLVRRSSKSGSGVIVLESRVSSEDKSLTATLGMNVIFSEEKECFVSSFNRQCADFHYQKSTNAQAISFESTYTKYYLVFVASTSKTDSNNPTQFLDQDIIVKVYAPDSDYQIASYYPPVLKDQKSSSTWLSLCFDGNYGLASQQPVNSYFANTNQQNKNFPSSSICDQLYKNNPFSATP